MDKRQSRRTQLSSYYISARMDSQRESLLLWITGAVCGGEETVCNVAEDFVQSNERSGTEPLQGLHLYNRTI